MGWNLSSVLDSNTQYLKTKIPYPLLDLGFLLKHRYPIFFKGVIPRTSPFVEQVGTDNGRSRLKLNLFIYLGINEFQLFP